MKPFSTAALTSRCFRNSRAAVKQCRQAAPAGMGYVLVALLLLCLSPPQTRAQTAAGIVPDIVPGNSHEFYFTRGIYSGAFDDYDEGGRWAVDYPKADHQFLVALKRLSVVDA